MKYSIYSRKLAQILTAFLLAGLLLLFSAGCGNGIDSDTGDDSDSAKAFQMADSKQFNGNWVPLSANAAENAMELRDGKVTWYVLNTERTAFIPMEEWVKQMIDTNEMVDSAEFTAELIGDQLTMTLKTKTVDGVENEEPVNGTLLLKGDTLTLLLPGGSIGNPENTVVFTRTDTPIAEYTINAG